MNKFIDQFINEARHIYGEEYIPLHRPVFLGNEKKYLLECIDSNFVSSVGKKVNEFEELVAEYTNSKYAIATVNGTSALHVAVQLAGVASNDEVLTQAVTFIATCNAIAYTGAKPIFIDVDKDTLGMSPRALRLFLEKNAEIRNNQCFNRLSGKKIAACIPMHTFGLPCRIEEISEICSEWKIILIEDIAESLGSFVGTKHTGKFSSMSTLSFNGNKIITTGGGGMIITDNDDLACRAKHLTTTAKVQHPYEFNHDMVGYNYRLPNINAALGCAQMEKLDVFLNEKREIFKLWRNFFSNKDIKFYSSLEGSQANYWLNAISFNSEKEKINFLEKTNESGVMTRPLWTLMSKLPMFKNCHNDGLPNSRWLEKRVVNIPSSVPHEIL